MPNRIIKESICTSEDIACLTMGAEILFYRLMVKVDDFGCYYGNEAIIKNTCFPLKTDEEISVRMVSGWVEELDRAGLIIRYIAEDGRKYLQLAKWEKHQRVRAKQSKFPQFADNCRQMTADDSKPPSNAPVIQSNPNPIQSEYVGQKTKRERFVPPTLEEIKAYCSERNNSVDPGKFLDYYSSNGWKVGKNPMKDWKAAVRNWERDDKPKPKQHEHKVEHNEDLDRLARRYGVG